mgnify:CR=1 FL=1
MEKKLLVQDLCVHANTTVILESISLTINTGEILGIIGPAGSGKTTFALQFLHNGAAKLQEPGLFITFAESKESIYRHALSFGWDFADLERKKLFQLLQINWRQYLQQFHQSRNLYQRSMEFHQS